MGQNDLGVSDLETQSIQELLAGDELTPVSIPAVLTTGATYKRGEVLALNSSTNKYVKFDAGGSNNTDKIAGILVEDVDASSGDVKSTIYIVGVFDKAALVTAESFDAGVHNSNGLLIIKELDD